VSASSIPQATFDYLSSLEWVRAQHNLAIVGPPGTGKSHTLIGLGHAAVHAAHKVRYFTAADLVDTLYRGLADNTVGKIIDALLRADLVIIDLCRPREYAEIVMAWPWAPFCGQYLGLGGSARVRHIHSPSRNAVSLSGVDIGPVSAAWG
jgi:hypothetical protein